MNEKKVYEPPTVKRVRLDIKESVLGTCQLSPTWVINPTCESQLIACPTDPTP